MFLLKFKFVQLSEKIQIENKASIKIILMLCKAVKISEYVMWHPSLDIESQDNKQYVYNTNNSKWNFWTMPNL